jgi:hypothetical protein
MVTTPSSVVSPTLTPSLVTRLLDRSPYPIVEDKSLGRDLPPNFVKNDLGWQHAAMRA